MTTTSEFGKNKYKDWDMVGLLLNALEHFPKENSKLGSLNGQLRFMIRGRENYYGSPNKNFYVLYSH